MAVPVLTDVSFPRKENAVMLDPEAGPAVGALAEQLRAKRIVALTGAGVSTESGIPDYRGPGSARPPTPRIQGPDFVRSAAVRRRYWARALVGWERFRLARPGAAHLAMAQLERGGVVRQVITQNVDRLHQAAGSREVIELHGALAEVVCLDCGVIEARDDVQSRLLEANPGWRAEARAVAPDGDAELAEGDVTGFRVPECLRCAGTLKPKVVFFGDSVARPLVELAMASIDAAEALLVAGTSLAVFSGYRFLRRAAERGIPIAIVNRGPVRGEEHAAVKIEASTGGVLQEIARRLG